MSKLQQTIRVLLLSIILLSCKEPEQINIWMIGDSTMAWKKPSRAPESGWGEGLKQFVKENATVHNHAASGRSTRSFITEGRWDRVKDSINRGDFVIIQFGHNDQKSDSARHTEPFTSFKNYLKKFIEETRQRGGIPIVCSSIVRRQFDLMGQLIDTHGNYIPATKQAAQETQTPYIDMERLTSQWVTRLGIEESKTIYNYTDRKQDSTHLNHHGAEVFARLFVGEVKERHLPIMEYLK